MAANDSISPAKMRAQMMRLIRSLFGRKTGAKSADHDWLQDKHNCLVQQLTVNVSEESSETPKTQIARWKTSHQRQIVRQMNTSKEQEFVPLEDGAILLDDERNHLYELSQSAKEELERIKLSKRNLVAKSLGSFLNEPDEKDCDTLIADEWNCSGTSLLGIASTQELSPVDRLMERAEFNDNSLSISSTVALTDSAISLKTIPPPPRKEQDEPNPAAQKQSANKRSAFNVPGNPYRHYADTALMLLANNPSTQRMTLIWLALHPNADIRSAVARNPSCSMETLAFLAKDPEAGIRHAIADNPKCSAKILEQLAADQNPLIAWRAQNSMNIARSRKTVTDLKPQAFKPGPKKMEPTRVGTHLPFSDQLAATEETINFLGLIARKSSTPPRRLSELARHPDARVRAAVAENANTPLELIWLLAKDPVQEVKLKVTENYNCPLDILEVLKDDADSYVSWQARSVLYRLTNPGQPNPFLEANNSVSNSSTKLRSVTSRELPQ